MKKRFEVIKAHFEKEALVFDKLFFKVAPHYDEMMTTVVEAVPFPKGKRLKVVDLGCGTGNFAQKLLKAFPKAQVTCVDMAKNMLAMARAKLGRNQSVSFWEGDVRDFDYSAKYDIILSSLVLHHIEKREKPAFFRKLCRALRPGGALFTIDIFLSPSPHLQKIFINQWKTFMKKNGLSPARIRDMLMRHRREDRPVCFEDELAMVRRAGFYQVEVLRKYYNFASYVAFKKV
ncbi:MAG: methyltransferase domain-containing protein [Candidatus Omnitrophota bacterium]|jgi:tRNA (cmo5U34)-methyltransferase